MLKTIGRRRLLGLLAALLLVACGDDGPTALPQAGFSPTPTGQPTSPPTVALSPTPEAPPQILFVGRQRVDCPGEEVAQDCLQIRENPVEPYRPLVGIIQGFTYEAGFEYELIVRPDSGAAGYILLDVVNKIRTYATLGPCRENYAGETIPLYFSADLSGPLSTAQGAAAGAVADAVAIINATGGVCGADLAVQVEDSRYDTERSLAGYRRFLDREPGAAVIFTASSQDAVALSERVIEDQVVNLTAGLNPEALYQSAGGHTIAVAPTYSDQFAGFVGWVHDHWAEVKPEDAGDEIVVGVIGWDNTFGRSATTAEALVFAQMLGVRVLPLAVQEISRTSDLTAQVQGLLAEGANVIYVQSAAHGPAQVIGTLWGVGAWQRVLVGGVNWAMNSDVPVILGQNAHLMAGFYGVFPYKWWNDSSDPAVDRLQAVFEAGQYPASDRGAAYLLTFGAIFALRDGLTHAVNRVGLAKLNGTALFEALEDLGSISAAGLFELELREGYRAPRLAQIRQAQLTDEGQIDFVVVEEFLELPDTRPTP